MPPGPDHPDLIVVTAGLTERATPAEYQVAYRLLEDLRTRLGVPTGRTVVVPGLSDVNEEGAGPTSWTGRPTARSRSRRTGRSGNRSPS